jgi:hypothetical protein
VTSGDFDAAWREAVDAAATLRSVAGALERDETQTVESLRKALHGLTGRGAAIVLLGHLDQAIVRALVGDVVGLALSHRHALEARQILGRLSYADAADRVPPAVWRQLEQTPDDDAYRRMAELLDHLGLDGALEELCRRAADSDDKDIREVAADFRS